VTGAAAQAGPEATIVHGHPSDVELAALSAALLTLLNAAADQPDEAPTPTTQGWRSRSRQLRLRPSPGHGAWKASVRRD